MRETEVTKFPYRWDSFREGRGELERQIENRCWCTGALLEEGLSWAGVESRCFEKFYLFCVFNALRTRILNNFVVLGKKNSLYSRKYTKKILFVHSDEFFEFDWDFVEFFCIYNMYLMKSYEKFE